MIVIFLITLITGAIGYNMRGSLNKGKEMRTHQAISQLKDLLLICLEEDKEATPEKLIADPAYFLKRSGIAKDPDQLIKDGWGEPLKIVYNKSQKDFEVSSKNVKL